MGDTRKPINKEMCSFPNTVLSAYDCSFQKDKPPPRTCGFSVRIPQSVIEFAKHFNQFSYKARKTNLDKDE